jgi:ABC-type uncharacterized transport system involved in gliding motility auxiliary subunit
LADRASIAVGDTQNRYGHPLQYTTLVGNLVKEVDIFLNTGFETYLLSGKH